MAAVVVTHEPRSEAISATSRAWPVASRRCAVVVMGLVCVPVHFWRTRRSALGLILGIAWLAALVVVLSAAEWIVSAVVGLALGMD
jgi:hypothetical protein